MAWPRFESCFHSIDAFVTWYHVYVYITKIERIRKKHSIRYTIWKDGDLDARLEENTNVFFYIFSRTNRWKYDKGENRKISLSTEEENVIEVYT